MLTSADFSIFMGIYIICYSIHATYQALVLTILSIYDSRWTNYYYFFMPVSHGFIVSLKALNLAMGLKDKIDITVIWLAFVAVTIAALLLFLSLAKTAKYNQQFSAHQTEQSLKNTSHKISFKFAFRIVGKESAGIFLSFFIAFINYPGVFFDSIVSRLDRPNISAQNWDLRYRLHLLPKSKHGDI